MAFSHFDRDTVEAAMGMLGIERGSLTGRARRAHYANVLDFETFDTLSDPVEYFDKAMTIELEHGKAARSVGANVTNDDALATARIAKAHLSGVEYGKPDTDPFPSYYDFLIWMEYLHSAAARARKDNI